MIANKDMKDYVKYLYNRIIIMQEDDKTIEEVSSANDDNLDIVDDQSEKIINIKDAYTNYHNVSLNAIFGNWLNISPTISVTTNIEQYLSILPTLDTYVLPNATELVYYPAVVEDIVVKRCRPIGHKKKIKQVVHREAEYRETQVRYSHDIDNGIVTEINRLNALEDISNENIDHILQFSNNDDTNIISQTLNIIVKKIEYSNERYESILKRCECLLNTKQDTEKIVYILSKHVDMLSEEILSFLVKLLDDSVSQTCTNNIMSILIQRMKKTDSKILDIIQQNIYSIKKEYCIALLYHDAQEYSHVLNHETMERLKIWEKEDVLLSKVIMILDKQKDPINNFADGKSTTRQAIANSIDKGISVEQLLTLARDLVSSNTHLVIHSMNMLTAVIKLQKQKIPILVLENLSEVIHNQIIHNIYREDALLALTFYMNRYMITTDVITRRLEKVIIQSNMGQNLVHIVAQTLVSLHNADLYYASSESLKYWENAIVSGNIKSIGIILDLADEHKISLRTVEYIKKTLHTNKVLELILKTMCYHNLSREDFELFLSLDYNSTIESILLKCRTNITQTLIHKFMNQMSNSVFVQLLQKAEGSMVINRLRNILISEPSFEIRDLASKKLHDNEQLKIQELLAKKINKGTKVDLSTVKKEIQKGEALTVSFINSLYELLKQDANSVHEIITYALMHNHYIPVELIYALLQKELQYSQPVLLVASQNPNNQILDTLIQYVKTHDVDITILANLVNYSTNPILINRLIELYQETGYHQIAIILDSLPNTELWSMIKNCGYDDMLNILNSENDVILFNCFISMDSFSDRIMDYFSTKKNYSDEQIEKICENIKFIHQEEHRNVLFKIVLRHKNVPIPHNISNLDSLVDSCSKEIEPLITYHHNYYKISDDVIREKIINKNLILEKALAPIHDEIYESLRTRCLKSIPKAMHGQLEIEATTKEERLKQIHVLDIYTSSTIKLVPALFQGIEFDSLARELLIMELALHIKHRPELVNPLGKFLNILETRYPKFSYERDAILADLCAHDLDYVSELFSKQNNLCLLSPLKTIVENCDFQKIYQWSQGIRGRVENNLAEALAYVKQAIYLSGLIGKNYPRNNQIIAVIELYKAKKYFIEEIATGEGKTIIALMYAALKVLDGHKVDIITSSKVLAKRDANLSKQFLTFFGITSNHNIDDNTKFYSSDIVYGDLQHFIGNYLKQLQDNKENRVTDIALVDEVDSMLIDQNAYKVILAQNVSGLHYLESVMMMIWNQLLLINSGFDTEKMELYYDDRTVHLDNWVQITKILENSVRTIYEESNISVPTHLKHFVNNHITKCSESAIQALYHLHENRDYVIRKNVQGNDVITSVDSRHTGVWQRNMSWSNGVHQFLAFKHHLKFFAENLQSHNMSYIGYLKKYRELKGITGTLGSTNDKKFLEQVYEATCITIPSFKPSIRKDEPGIIASNQQEWQDSIVNSVEQILHDNRAMILICKHIQSANHLFSILVKKYKNVYKYIDDQQEIITYLDSRDILIATNLAGRGLDIQNSPALLRHGGVHVCLTFLPMNAQEILFRVILQAFGRAGRHGNPGSTQIIAYHKSKSALQLIQEFEQNMEQQLERDIEKTKIILFEDDLYQQYIKTVHIIQSRLSENEKKYFIPQLHERWALWLQDHEVKYDNFENIMREFERFKYEIQNSKLLISQRYVLSKAVIHKDISIYEEAIKKDTIFAYIASYYKVIQLVDNNRKKSNIFQSIIDNLEETHNMVQNRIIPYYHNLLNYSNCIDKQEAISQQIMQKIAILNSLLGNIRSNISNVKINHAITVSNMIVLRDTFSEVQDFESEGLLYFYELKSYSLPKPRRWLGHLVYLGFAIIQIASGLVLSYASQALYSLGREAIALGVKKISSTMLISGFKDVISAMHKETNIKNYFEGKKIDYAISLITMGIKSIIDVAPSSEINNIASPPNLKEMMLQRMKEYVIHQSVSAIASTVTQTKEEDIATKVEAKIRKVLDGHKLYLDRLYAIDKLRSNDYYHEKIMEKAVLLIQKFYNIKLLSQIAKGTSENFMPLLTHVYSASKAIKDVDKVTGNYINELCCFIKILHDSSPSDIQLLNEKLNLENSELNNQVIAYLKNSEYIVNDYMQNNIDNLPLKDLSYDLRTNIIEQYSDIYNILKQIHEKNNLVNYITNSLTKYIMERITQDVIHKPISDIIKCIEHANKRTLNHIKEQIAENSTEQTDNQLQTPTQQIKNIKEQITGNSTEQTNTQSQASTQQIKNITDDKHQQSTIKNNINQVITFQESAVINEINGCDAQSNNRSLSVIQEMTIECFKGAAPDVIKGIKKHVPKSALTGAMYGARNRSFPGAVVGTLLGGLVGIGKGTQQGLVKGGAKECAMDVISVIAKESSSSIASGEYVKRLLTPNTQEDLKQALHKYYSQTHGGFGL